MDDEGDSVVIIGAGICGLATAVALHKKGIKSLVVERSETLRNVTGAAISIRQNGWRALHQLGVADILRCTAIPILGERIISLDEGKQEEYSIYSTHGETRCLRRKDIIDTLYDALPPNTLKFGCQLESIKLDPNTTKPVLRFVDGSSIMPKIVIGCDGSKSIIASFLNISNTTNMFPFCEVRGLTHYPNGHSLYHEFARFKKDNILVGRIPIDDNLVYWFCTQPYIHKDHRSICEDPEVIRQSTLELIYNYPREIQEMIEHADMQSLWFSHLRYHSPWDLLTATFCKGTVTVAGDAMHVMAPFLGQGGSAGLEDAVVLAREMAQSGLNRFESGSNKLTVHGVGEAFNRFVKQRRMRVVRLSLQSYLTGIRLGTTSRLDKFMSIVLLSLLFRNKNGHVDYDCGDL